LFCLFLVILAEIVLVTHLMGLITHDLRPGV
jgi:hypothetical protein